MMDYALQRGFEVRMFTSGIMSEAKRDAIAAVWAKHADRKVHFIVNLNHPSETPAAQQTAQAAFLERAAERASLSFNIYREDFDLTFAFEAIAKHGLTRRIRLGLAHPIAAADDDNQYVGPAGYRHVADRLASFAADFERERVTPGFDCGFPICMFRDAELGAFVKLGATFHWMCGPIVDIGPDLDLWPCFPLSHLRGKSLYEFDSLTEIITMLADDVRQRRGERIGIFNECQECSLRERRLCNGGCQTYVLREASKPEVHSAARRPARPAP
jgi:radical SAM protein with 4Fe4S-binding SPASM domain